MDPNAITNEVNAWSQRMNSTYELNAGTPRILKYSEKSNINGKMLNKLFDKQLCNIAHLGQPWQMLSTRTLDIIKIIEEEKNKFLNDILFSHFKV